MTNSLLVGTLVIPLLRFDYPYRWLKWSVPTGRPALNPIIPIRIPNRPRLWYIRYVYGVPYPWIKNIYWIQREMIIEEIVSRRKIKIHMSEYEILDDDWIQKEIIESCIIVVTVNIIISSSTSLINYTLINE